MPLTGITPNGARPALGRPGRFLSLLLADGEARPERDDCGTVAEVRKRETRETIPLSGFQAMIATHETATEGAEGAEEAKPVKSQV
mgnify:CR=1 FL=1